MTDASYVWSDRRQKLQNRPENQRNCKIRILFRRTISIQVHLSWAVDLAAYLEGTGTTLAS